MMDISGLIRDYGYWAVFVGSFLEGETVLLLAGFAAHRGLLHLPDVLLLACVASTLGDQLSYWIGRRWGLQLFARYPSLGRHVPRVQALLQRHHMPLVLGIRFLYGLRMAGPMVMGAMHVPAARFAVLNLLGAAVWAVLVGWMGYQFGNLIQAALPQLRHIEEGALAAALLAGLAWWLARHLRARTKHGPGAGV